MYIDPQKVLWVLNVVSLLTLVGISWCLYRIVIKGDN